MQDFIFPFNSLPAPEPKHPRYEHADLCFRRNPFVIRPDPGRRQFSFFLHGSRVRVYWRIGYRRVTWLALCCVALDCVRVCPVCLSLHVVSALRRTDVGMLPDSHYARRGHVCTVYYRFV